MTDREFKQALVIAIAPVVTEFELHHALRDAVVDYSNIASKIAYAIEEIVEKTKIN